MGKRRQFNGLVRVEPPPGERDYALQAKLRDLGVDLPGLCSAAAGETVVFGAAGIKDRQAAWARLRELHTDTGLWPFLSGERPADWAHRVHWSGGTAPASLLSPSAAIAELMQATQDKWPPETVLSGLPVDPARDSKFLENFSYATEWLVLMPAAAAGTDLSLVLHAPNAVNWTGNSPHVHLTASDHAALWGSWYDRFGAEIQFLNNSGVEFVVSRPPTSPAEIADVTKEHWAYCPDLSQVFGTPERVATKQVPARRWYFWWDSLRMPR